MNDMIDYIKNEGQIAILDGTNESRSEREFIKNSLEACRVPIYLMWIESIVD